MTHFYTIQEAADYLRVDYKVVYRLVKEGKLPSSRVGWQFRITQEDLNAYLAAERAKQESVAHSLRTAGRPAEPPVPPATAAPAGIPAGGGVDGHGPAATPPGKVVATPARAGVAGVSKLRARQMEQNFVNRFNEKVESVDTIRHPATGQILRIDDWGPCHEQREDRAALMHALNTAFLDRRTLATTPRNVRSRYAVAGDPPFVVEARCLAHLDALCQQGSDERPADEEDLMQVIDECEEEHNATGAALVVGLASPTGWTAEAIRYIDNSGRGNSYRHPRVRLLLVDLRSEAVYFDPHDDVTPGFAGLFAAATDEENVAGLRTQLEAELDGRTGILLADFAESTGVSWELAEAAARQLAAQGGYRLVPDKSDGWILVKV
jgi:excisionase family DNA binding protein